MPRDSFAFYRSFIESIEELDELQQLRILKAIIHYALDGAVPQMSGYEGAIFKITKPLLDTAEKRYQQQIANGKKGGNPNFVKGQPNPYYAKKSIAAEGSDRPSNEVATTAKDNRTLPKDNPTLPTHNLNVDVNDNVNVHVNDNDDVHAHVDDNVHVNDTVHVHDTVHENGEWLASPSGDACAWERVGAHACEREGADARESGASLSVGANAEAECFWNAYPKKIGQREVFQWFEQAKLSKEQLQEILSAVEQHKASAQWQRGEGRYIPNPINYLEKQKWRDTLSAKSSPPSPPKSIYADFDNPAFLAEAW